MTRIRLGLGLSVAILTISSGCRVRKFNTESSVKHTDKTLLDSASQGGVWASVNASQYLSYLQNFVLFTELKPLETSDPRVQKLQAMADKIHAYWISLGDARTTKIPKPEIIIIKAEAENAFADNIFTCLENPNASEADSLTIFNGKSASLKYMDGGGKEFCKAGITDPRIARETYEAMGRFIAERDPTGRVCRPDSGSPTPHFAGDCAATQNPNARFVAIPASANKLVVNSRLLETSTDEELAYVLAHELAHYYRSHTVTPRRISDFFYRESESRNGKPFPVSSPEVLSLQKEMLTLADRVWLRDVDGSLLSRSGIKDIFFKRVRFGARGTSSVDSILQGTGADICQPYKAFVKDNARLSVLQKTTVLSHEDLQIFSEGERTISACLDDISSQGGEAAQKLTTFLSEQCSRIGCQVNTAGNPRDAFGILNSTLRTQAKRYGDLVPRGMTAGISWYTVEQEADDYALEMMSRALGISPTKALPAVTRLVKYDPDTIDNMRPDECRATYERGFRTQNTWTPVPFGPLTDDHHGACYRLYNILREISAHGWPSSSPLPPWQP